MRPLAAVSLLLVFACAGGEEGDTSFGSNPTAPMATAGMTATMTMPTGGPEPTTGATGADTGMDATGDTAATSSPSSPSTDPGTDGGTVPGTTDATTGFDTNPDGLPNGSECMTPAVCQTGDCYVVKIPVEGLPPGICSECDADQDCVDKGLGIACTVDASDFSGVCTDGGLGSFCESQNACKAGYFCEELVAGAQGLLPSACSECRDDADCDGGKRCTPRIDVGMYEGNKFCAAPGSVPNDGMCPIPTGNDVCANGHCNTLNLFGMLDVGVCGACATDADCVAPKICQPGKFDEGFFGTVCG